MATKAANKQRKTNQEELIDILAFFQFLKKRMKLLLFGLFIGALAGWILSTFVISPKYTSYVDLYVTNNKKSETRSQEYEMMSLKMSHFQKGIKTIIRCLP